MTLDPFFAASPVIQIHAIAAMLAILVGPVAIYRKRRDRIHKVAGYTWVIAMGLAALSSFGITSFGIIGPLSPIHALAVLALWSLWMGLKQIFQGNVRAHAATMRSLYWRGLMIAGLFQFLPGRTTNRVFMNDAREFGYFIIAFGLAAILISALRGRRSQLRLA